MGGSCRRHSSPRSRPDLRGWDSPFRARTVTASIRRELVARRAVQSVEVIASPFHVRRIGSPRWAQFEESSRLPKDLDLHLTGEQAEWGWGIPLAYQTLASPMTGLPVPRKPRQGCKLSDATGYWATLLHLCLFSVGWVRPERGLLTMGTEDWPWIEDQEGDAVLRFIDRVWNKDGHLDLFVAWLSRWGVLHVLGDFEVLTQESFDRSPTSLDGDWLDQQTARADQLDCPAPKPAGDPLHLSAHCRGPIADLAEFGSCGLRSRRRCTSIPPAVTRQP